MPAGISILLLLILFGLGGLAACWFGRRLRTSTQNDLVARHRQLRGVVILYGILLVMMTISACQRHDQSLFKKLLPPTCFAVCFGSFFFQFLRARRKVIKAGLLEPRVKRVPPIFLWQAAFILLPVVGLALFGLFSLRQDRLLAQQAAKEIGNSIAQQWSQAISREGARQLQDYREASFDLDANRTMDLGLSGWAGGAQSESNAWQRIKMWQQANPAIDLTTLPPTDNTVGFRPEFYSSPQIYPSPPRPPAWLRQLTSEQKQLWQAVAQAEFVSKDFAAAQSILEKFIATQPPPGARANAEYLLLLAKTHGMPADEAVTKIAEFSRSHWGDADQLTDAGLPVGQLICYQALHRLSDGAGWPENFIRYHTIAWMIYYRAAIFSPLLIAEAERVARGTEEAQNAATLKTWWESDEKARQILSDFREQYPKNVWKAASFWTASPFGKFLITLDSGYQTTNHSTLETSYRLLMFPEAVVVKAADFAAAQSGISLPPYAVAEWEIGGHKFGLPPNKPPMELNARPLLGKADGELRNLPLLSAAYPFQVRVFLAHPDVLYARQRERTWIFGALIVAATLAAVMGLFGAYRSFRRQQELNEMKSNFVSSVSHELRAPIASVRLMAENLERGKIADAPKQNEYFRFIVQECRRLSSLIENVLDFSRIEQNRKQYDFEPTNLNALVQQTVKLMAPYAAEKNVKLVFVEPNSNRSRGDEAQTEEKSAPSHVGGYNFELNADGRALQQALINLMDNAVKHSPKGETVTLGLDYGQRRTGGAPGSDFPEPKQMETAATAVLLSVADCGPGIPREEHGKIFERFYRRGSELRRETPGVGIGLSIVKHIVEAHGGTVLVESKIGQGSKFTIVFPIKNETTDAHR